MEAHEGQLLVQGAADIGVDQGAALGGIVARLAALGLHTGLHSRSVLDDGQPVDAVLAACPQVEQRWDHVREHDRGVGDADGPRVGIVVVVEEEDGDGAREIRGQV